MEARRALNGPAISKNTVIVIAALLAALVVLAIGGLLVKTMSVPAAAPARQTVTGQPGASGFGSAWNYSNLRSGTQSVEGPAPATAPAGSKLHEPGSRRGGAQV